MLSDKFHVDSSDDAILVWASLASWTKSRKINGIRNNIMKKPKKVAIAIYQSVFFIIRVDSSRFFWSAKIPHQSDRPPEL